MAESQGEIILQTLQSWLASHIVADGGATYWYTPDHVLRVDGWQKWEMDWLHPEYQAVLFLRPGIKKEEERTTGKILVTMEVWVLYGVRFNPASQDPLYLASNPPQGWTIAERMERDLRMAIRTDITFGLSSIINTQITDINHSLPFVTGWALVEARLQIMFDFLYNQP